MFQEQNQRTQQSCLQYNLPTVSNNHPKANIFHFKIIDQDSKQVAREARETIHIRINILELIKINNLSLNCNMGKMYIPEIVNNLPGEDGSTNESNPWGDSDPLVTFTFLFLVMGWPQQCVWQIK